MGLVLNEEQQQFQDILKRFFSENAPVEQLRSLRDGDDALGYSQELWQELAAMGVAGVLVPETYGGADFGVQGLAIAMQEAGHTLAASPLFATSVLGVAVLLKSEDETWQQQLLPQVAAGETTLCLAFEESRHHNPQHILTSAQKDGEDYVLNGEKTWVVDGHSADFVIMAARTSGDADDEDGVSLFVVDANTEGLTRTRLNMVDSRNVAHLKCQNLRLPKTALLGKEGCGKAYLEYALDIGRSCLAAEMLGSCIELSDRTLAYLKEREQFGVKIGSFQALKHRAAKMCIDLEMAKSIVVATVTAMDEQQDMPRYASMAKAKLNETYRLISDEAVQMHGGMAVTDELEIGFFLKRSRVAIQLLGDTNWHRERFACLAGY